MTEPLFLPTGRLSAAQLTNLTKDLAEKYAAGVDLGSRVPHIHEASATIQKLWIKLKSDIDNLERLGIIGIDEKILDLIKMASCELITIENLTNNR